MMLPDAMGAQVGVSGTPRTVGCKMRRTLLPQPGEGIKYLSTRPPPRELSSFALGQGNVLFALILNNYGCKICVSYCR